MIEISLLLPTRGRTTALEKSLRSYYELAQNHSSIELLLAFDNDDQESIDYCQQNILPWLDSINTKYTVFKFNRLGYHQLHLYLNYLSARAQGYWLFFINDDSVMSTSGWDNVIKQQPKQISLLRAETNQQHPYALFPIIPKTWVEITGGFSQHQLNDAWVSQIAWMLDVVKTIPVDIVHERYDVTGNNHDDTFKNRPTFEGNPQDPRDFNHKDCHQTRMQETAKLANYIETVEKQQLPRYHEAMQGKIPMWEKMLKLDVKGQMKVY
jgi:hypothetical protein